MRPSHNNNVTASLDQWFWHTNVHLPPFVEHQHAVGQPQQFWQFGRNEDHPDPASLGPE